MKATEGFFGAPGARAGCMKPFSSHLPVGCGHSAGDRPRRTAYRLSARLNLAGMTLAATTYVEVWLLLFFLVSLPFPLPVLVLALS